MDEWICDKIVDFRPQDPKKNDGIPQWKAHWQGFPKSDDSWEPESSFLPKFHPGGVQIGKEGRRCFPAVVGFREALPVGLPLWDPVLLLWVLRAKAHNFLPDPLVWVGWVCGLVVSGIV